MQIQTIRRQGAATLAAGTCFFLLLGHGALAQETPLEIVDAWLEQANAVPFLEVEAGDIAYDAETAVTTVSDLHIAVDIGPDELTLPTEPDTGGPEAISYDIRFPQLTFSGLSADADDYRADEIRVRGGSAVMEIEASDGAGDIASTTQFTEYAVRDVRWSRLPEIAEDPEHPVSRFYPLAEALLDFDFSGAELGPLVTIADLPEGVGRQTIIYGPWKVGAASHGDISSATLDIFTMSLDGADKDDNPFHVSMHAGPVTVENYNYGTLVRTFAPGAVAAPDADRPYRAFLGTIHMPGLSVTGMAGPARIEFEGGIGSISVEDIGVRAPLIDVLGRFDDLAIQAQQPDAPEPDQKEIIELVASIYGSLRLGLFEIAELHFDVGDVANGTIESVRLRDLSASGLDEFSESGVDVHGPEGFVSRLDRASIEDVSFPSLEALMGLQAASERQDVAAMMQAIPTIGRILYSGLDIRAPGEMEMQLEKGLLEMEDHIGPIPTRIDLQIDGFRMPIEYMDSDAREQMRALGYDALDASLAVSADWNGASETARLAGNGELADGGRFTINAELGGLKRLFFENPQAAAMRLALLTFNKADFSFEDNSIRDRLLRVVAEKQNTTPEMVEQMAMGAMPFLLAPLQRPELVGQTAAALKKFFDGEGNLAISAAPQTPVPLIGAIAGAKTDPGAVVDSLNLTIDAE